MGRTTYRPAPVSARADTLYVEREKMLMVRPAEPPKDQMADAPEKPPEGGFEE